MLGGFDRQEFEKRLQMLKEEFAPVAARAVELKERETLSQVIKAMNERIQQNLSAQVRKK